MNYHFFFSKHSDEFEGWTKDKRIAKEIKKKRPDLIHYKDDEETVEAISDYKKEINNNTEFYFDTLIKNYTTDNDIQFYYEDISMGIMEDIYTLVTNSTHIEILQFLRGEFKEVALGLTNYVRAIIFMVLDMNYFFGDTEDDICEEVIDVNHLRELIQFIDKDFYYDKSEYVEQSMNDPLLFNIYKQNITFEDIAKKKGLDIDI